MYINLAARSVPAYQRAGVESFSPSLYWGAQCGAVYSAEPFFSVR
jgi:hypothetical protein